MNDTKKYLEEWKELGNAIDEVCLGEKNSSNLEKETEFAYKLYDFISEGNLPADFIAKEAINRTNKIMKNKDMHDLTSGHGRIMGDAVAAVYVHSMRVCGNSVSKETACEVIKNIYNLRRTVNHPEALLTCVVSCLGDEKVADLFLSAEKNVLSDIVENNRDDEKNNPVSKPYTRTINEKDSSIFDVCSYIVRTHPDKAQKCNEVVSLAMECLPEGYMHHKNIDAYYKTVSETEGVSKEDKAVAKENSEKKRGAVSWDVPKISRGRDWSGM